MAGKRVRMPDTSTPEGQCALYLQHLLLEHGRNAEEIAEVINKTRSTVYNYLSGDTSPSDTIRDIIAKSLGLKDFRALMPTDKFLASIRQPDPKRRG